MELFRRLVIEEDGQGLVEYTLMVLLVALVFWVAIRDTLALACRFIKQTLKTGTFPKTTQRKLLKFQANRLPMQFR